MTPTPFDRGDGGRCGALCAARCVRDRVKEADPVHIDRAHARAGGRTWLYDFTWRGPAGATHGIDVPFVLSL